MIPVKPAENFPSRKVDASAFSKSKRWRAVSNYGRAKSVRLLEDNFDPYHKPDAPAVEHADQKINPFQPLDGNYGGPPIPPYEWFKLIITGPVVFLVRVLLLIPTFSLMVIIAHIAVFALRSQALLRMLHLSLVGGCSLSRFCRNLPGSFFLSAGSTG